MKTIEDLAREAGLDVYDDHLSCYETNTAQRSVAERFAALVRDQALDEAAAVCDTISKTSMPGVYDSGAMKCSEALHALKDRT